MDYQLLATEPVADGLSRVVLALLDDAIDNLISGQGDVGTSIHAVRKTTKRIRALLRLGRSGLAPAVYRRENAAVREASARLSGLRDSAVLLATLEQIMPEEPPPLQERVRRALTDRHEELARHLLHEGDALNRAADQLAAVRRRMAVLTLEGAGFDLLAPGLGRTYRRGRRRLAVARASGHDPVCFHEWRKRVKYQWYQLESLNPIWPEALAFWIAALHRLSDLLGDAHDLAVLRQTLLDEPARFGPASALAPLLTRLNDQRRAIEAAALSPGNRLYAERPAAFVRRHGVYWSAWLAEPADRPVLSGAAPATEAAPA